METGYPDEELVRQRAYQIGLLRGFQPGHATDDWLQAKNELLQSAVGTTTKLEPTKTKKGGKDLGDCPNGTGSFAWFWGGPR